MDAITLEKIVVAIAESPSLETASRKLGWTYDYFTQYLGRPEVTEALDLWRRSRQNALLLKCQIFLEESVEFLHATVADRDVSMKDRLAAAKDLKALNNELNEHTELGARLGALENRVRQALLTLPSGLIPELDDGATEKEGRVLEAVEAAVRSAAD